MSSIGFGSGQPPRSVLLATSFAAGVAATYGAGRALGYAPGWYGPELPHWNAASWNKDAEYIINELQGDPSLVCTAQSLIGKAGRKVRTARFYSVSDKSLKGVVKYGSDCEGPPRCVHGGCTAATSNIIAADLAYQVLGHPLKHPTIVNVDYLMKIPLGSQLEFECVTSELTQDKIQLRVCFHKLRKPSEIYAISKVTFDLKGTGTSPESKL